MDPAEPLEEKERFERRSSSLSSKSSFCLFAAALSSVLLYFCYTKEPEMFDRLKSAEETFYFFVG